MHVEDRGVERPGQNTGRPPSGLGGGRLSAKVGRENFSVRQTPGGEALKHGSRKRKSRRVCPTAPFLGKQDLFDRGCIRSDVLAQSPLRVQGDRDMTPSVPANRMASIGIAIATVIVLFPVLSVTVPPILDYPNHYARLWLLSGGANDP